MHCFFFPNRPTCCLVIWSAWGQLCPHTLLAQKVSVLWVKGGSVGGQQTARHDANCIRHTQQQLRSGFSQGKTAECQRLGKTVEECTFVNTEKKLTLSLRSQHKVTQGGPYYTADSSESLKLNWRVNYLLYNTHKDSKAMWGWFNFNRNYSLLEIKESECMKSYSRTTSWWVCECIGIKHIWFHLDTINLITEQNVCHSLIILGLYIWVPHKWGIK